MQARYPLNTDKIHTLVDLFEARAAKSPSLPAYRQFLPGVERWHTYTWNDVASRVRAWTSALEREGLEPGDRVAIMSGNRPDWIALDLAALSLRLVVVAVFDDNTPGNAAATLEHSGARLLVVEEPQWWTGISQEAELPEIQRVVSIKAESSQQEGRMVALSKWLDAATDSARTRPRRPLAQADDLAVICYTSGTSGRPKGVMLSHRNILSNVLACHAAIPMREGDVALSFLPLAHMFERTAGYYHAILAGAEVVFCRDIKHLSEDFREVRPSVIISVPRVFERFYALIQRRVRQRPLLFRQLFRLAVDAGWRHFLYQQHRGPKPLFDRAWMRLTRSLGRNVLDALGGNMRLAVSGGAPLSPQIARTFIALGLPIVQGYGLTEAGPVVSTNTEEDNDPESVGLPLGGVETRRSAKGELEVRGPNVMMGYWQDAEATAEVLTDDGWLRTGDKISRLQSDRLFVIGRIKELIVMSNGEKAAPALLEQELMLDPLVEQCLVIGEARPYLAALIVPNPEAMAEFLEDNELADGDPKLPAHLLARIQADLADQPKFAQIRRIALLQEPWSTKNDMLTPTQKPRRRRIMQIYAEQIENLYSGHYTPEDASLNYHVDLG